MIFTVMCARINCMMSGLLPGAYNTRYADALSDAGT